MARWSVCSTPDCGQMHQGTGRCPECRRAADKNRRKGQVSYSSKEHRTFRTAVLQRDPTCRLCGDTATVADHYPISRRDLAATGQNPNDPAAGRGLCAPCHNRETATHQPGGWNHRE